MKRFIRLFFAVLAVLTLMGYFFADLVLSEGPQAASWEEFSGNRAAAARFQDRHELAGGRTSDLQKAYEQQASSMRATQGLSASREHVGGEVLDLKGKWQRVYEVFTPRRGWAARWLTQPGRWLAIPPFAVGVAATLAILAGAVMALTVLIAKLDRKARS